MNEIDICFGNNLRRLRKAKGLSQEEFAEECGISRAYYGKIERGENSTSIQKCADIASALGIPISELFRDLTRL